MSRLPPHVVTANVTWYARLAGIEYFWRIVNNYTVPQRISKMHRRSARCGAVAMQRSRQWRIVSIEDSGASRACLWQASPDDISTRARDAIGRKNTHIAQGMRVSGFRHSLRAKEQWCRAAGAARTPWLVNTRRVGIWRRPSRINFSRSALTLL